MATDPLARRVLGVILPSLLIGSAGGPLFFVIYTLLAPAGFNDLRGAPAGDVVGHFVTAWLFSVAITAPIGAALWHELHRRRLDGVLSYSVIAVVAAGLLSLAAAQKVPSPLLIGIAVSNALLIWLVERIASRAGGQL